MGQRTGNDSFEPDRTATNLLNNCTQPTWYYHSTCELRIALTSFHRIKFHGLTLQRLKKSSAEVFICPTLPVIRWGLSIGGITMAGGNEVVGEKSVPFEICPQYTSHGLALDQTRVSEVRGRRLIAWAMERSFKERNSPENIKIQFLLKKERNIWPIQRQIKLLLLLLLLRDRMMGRLKIVSNADT